MEHHPHDPSLKDSKHIVHEANMNQAMRKYYLRTGAEQPCFDMPFDRILRSEEYDGDDEALEVDEDVLAQRREAIRGVFRYLVAEGPHPLKIMKRLYAVGRGLMIEPFCELTMDESALMFSESKAAHSWRVKFLSGVIERCGMKGSRLPGQKNKSSTANYSMSQAGNSNRRKREAYEVKGATAPK